MTDSASVADPKDPDNSSIYSILKLFCTAEERLLWADRFRSGGLGYREVKQAIFDLFMRTFGAARRLFSPILEAYPNPSLDRGQVLVRLAVACARLDDKPGLAAAREKLAALPNTRISPAAL